jgi:hypothetical protein
MILPHKESFMGFFIPKPLEVGEQHQFQKKRQSDVKKSYYFRKIINNR